MARAFYPSDNLIVAAGAGTPAALTLAPGAEFSVWSAKTGGSKYTDLLAEDGVTALPVNGAGNPFCDANGNPPSLYGPDNVSGVLWRQTTGTLRYPMYPSTDIHGMLLNGARKDAANTFTTAQTFSAAVSFSSTPTVSGSLVVTAANLAAQMAVSANLGAFLNATGQPYFIYVDPTTGLWPNSGARTVPTGFTGRVIWDSLSYAGALKPVGMINNDTWRERVA